VQELYELLRVHYTNWSIAELEYIKRKIEEYEQFIKDNEERETGELNAEEIERQCDQLFGAAPPVRFKAQKNNELERRIAEVIQQENIRIPVVFLKDELYFIGATKACCILKSGNVIVRVGGGQYPFEEWVPFNHRIFERIIVINMINSNQTMEWVIGQMISDKKIPAVLYPLTSQTTGKISSPERERNASPLQKKRTSVNSPARFARTPTSPSGRSPTGNF
jgi:hypothetical protein